MENAAPEEALTERSLPDWLAQNQQVVKCVALETSEAIFSVYMAALQAEPYGLVWWKFAYDALVSTAQIFACKAPKEEVFQSAFGGKNKRCQCAEVGGQLFFAYLDSSGSEVSSEQSGLTDAKKIIQAFTEAGVSTCIWETVSGSEKTLTADIGTGTRPIWYIVPTLDTECCKNTPEVPPTPPAPAPFVFQGEGTECVVTVRLLDSCVDKFGLSQNFYEVTQSQECNPDAGFDRYWYWESVRGPVVYSASKSRTFEGFTAEPPYAPPHPHAAVPSSGGASISGLDAVGYILDVGCSWDPEEEEFTKKYQFEVEANTDGILGLARRMDALALMINNAQLIPYTDCNEKPPLEGEFRTIGFISEKTSPYGKSRLRKRLRYRSVSGIGLDDLIDHWKDFEFDSGPVIVQHRGASWGTVKCWAASADEGKRVIRHAAGEAGIDPDQVGRWEISGSNSPRLGVSDTMKVNQSGGYYWITARDGSDNRPLVGVT